MTMTLELMSGGYDEPLGLALKDIEGLGNKAQRNVLLNLLLTAAEFYGTGRSIGYQEGYEQGVKEATGAEE